MINFFKFFSNIYEESFINRFFSLIYNLFNESYLNKFFKKIKLLYLNSFIYSNITKEDEEISIKLNFRLIKYKGTIESMIIFISIFGIFLSLNISDLIIKILILILLYLILYFTIFDKEYLKNSFIYKVISGSIYG